MDNQPIDQTPEQPIEQAVVQQPKNSSSTKMWYTIVAIVAVALGLAYFVMNSSIEDDDIDEAQTSEIQSETQSQTNTTEDISADLDLIISDAGDLDAEADASASDLGSF